MRFSRFFVNRPIFAVVISVLFLVGGGLALFRLPLSEYPAVSPPTVQVTTSFPGASPQVIAETVAGPLEQVINGADGVIYTSSQSSSDGRMALTVTFEHGVDPDLAEVQIQNRVARALTRLPTEVQQQGVITQKVSPDILMVAHLVSPEGRYNPLHLSNFAALQVRDELARLDGVGEVIIWGAGEYAMRIWLDPAKLAARGLGTSDVIAAVREQNVQVAAGSVGQSPGSSAEFQLSVNTLGRLTEESEFADIVVKTGALGQSVRLKDVARIELGSDNYSLRALLDGKPAVALQIIQSPGANALDTAARVRAKMAQLAETFPDGIEYRIAYDPTVFVSASIAEVLKTLLEATVLVVIVVVLFLKSWRASLIPLIAIPVSLVGSLAILQLLGFSLNTLSLFGLVLSIGIVVDDAIVVVENVERHLANGLPPREAARRAMDEVTGPIIAITTVLAAVFIPSAFLGGLQGEFYRQFALTIAITTILSAINSLTLSPALAGVLLRPHRPTSTGSRTNGAFARLSLALNRGAHSASTGYVSVVQRMIRVSILVAVVYGGLVALTALGFSRTAQGFIPAQDKYYLVGIVQLPNAAALDRTEAVTKMISEMALAEKGVESVVAFPGLSINGFVNIPNAAVMFIMLDPFEDRKEEHLSAQAIAGRLQAQFASVPDGFIGVFPPPPVPGLGALGGFKMQVEDRNGAGLEALAAVTGAIMQKASQTPELAGLLSSFDINAPQIDLEINREKAKAIGLPLGSIFETLQVHLGSMYVNDFNRFGRTYKVVAQADASHRMSGDDIARLEVRSNSGEMVPLSTLVRIRDTAGPDRVMHYNGYPSSDISGGPAPGISSTEAVIAMERIARETLPEGMTFEWTDLTYQEKAAGNSAIYIFPLSILLAFLILAALYNSWSMPLAVLLIVPMALLSAMTGVWLTAGDNNIFTQVGLVVLIGLAAKNSILIVEFARKRELEGETAVSAALEGARLRLRPIIMTSLAFIAGVIPLALAHGAGAEMRQAMGVAVVFGMLGVTLFGILLTPVFYVLVRRLEVLMRGGKNRNRPTSQRLLPGEPSA